MIALKSNIGRWAKKVRDGRHEQARIFFELPNSGITHVAEQASDLAGLMVVVDGENGPVIPASSGLTANGAQPVLRFVHLLPFASRHAVLELEASSLGDHNLHKKLTSRKGILWHLLIQRQIAPLGIFIASWRMCYQGVVAILNAAMRAWFKYPSQRTPDNDVTLLVDPLPGLSPFVIATQPACFTYTASAGLGMYRLREVGDFFELLAYRADLFLGCLIGAFYAFMPSMAKEALGRNRFSAPSAPDYSLYYSGLPGHCFSPRAKSEFLSSEYTPNVRKQQIFVKD